MSTHVVAWSQWADLDTLDGVELLSDPGGVPRPEVLDRITFYVPTYLGGRRAMEPVRQMPALTVVQLPTAGYEHATGYLPPGVTLCNARGVHDESTAELAVGLALAGCRGFRDFADDAREGRWRSERHRSLTDSKIAIVGYGSIGATIHRMLGGFEVTVTAFSRSGRGVARPVTELADAIGSFDVVILVVPLTDETRGLFDAAMLARMRDGAVLVNVSRGPVVDTGALLAELSTGRLAAGLDVTDPEPLPADHPLWQAPNCLITPHVGGDTTAFEPRMRALIADQLRRLVDDEALRNVVTDR